MLKPLSEQLDKTSIKIRVCWQGTPVSTGDALELCRVDESFRTQLITVLAASPFTAYFWETPPITVSSLDRPFEFVLTHAPGLATASPDLGAFKEYFESDHDDDGVVTFENLGRDATLIVPCPLASAAGYVHFASFLRNAPAAQQQSLFRRIAAEALSCVSRHPLWLSTAGMGVYWLHVRLDTRPKYYRHAPYKSLDVA